MRDCIDGSACGQRPSLDPGLSRKSSAVLICSSWCSILSRSSPACALSSSSTSFCFRASKFSITVLTSPPI